MSLSDFAFVAYFAIMSVVLVALVLVMATNWLLDKKQRDRWSGKR